MGGTNLRRAEDFLKWPFIHVVLSHVFIWCYRCRTPQCEPLPELFPAFKTIIEYYVLCIYVLMTLCVQSKLLMGAARIFSSLMHWRAVTAVYLLQNYLYSTK